MDLGLAFEDEDLLCNEKKRIGDRHLPYNVKICSNQWFEDVLQEQTFDENSKDNDTEQQLTIEKFSADFHYQQKDYTTALMKYKKLADRLSSKNNSALYHDIQESLSRCYMYTEQTEQGLHVAKEMVKASLKEDEARQRQALALLSFAHEKAENWAECIDTLEHLCELQPQFPQTWHKLGDVYNHFQLQQELSTMDEDILLVKQLSSYLRAKLLFQSVMGTASEFLKDRNIAIIEQLTTKIDQVPLSESRKTYASKFILREVENQATSSKVQESTLVRDGSTTGEPVKETFYEKFCSWNSSCES